MGHGVGFEATGPQSGVKPAFSPIGVAYNELFLSDVKFCYFQ